MCFVFGVMFDFTWLLRARYVPNVGKKSIWDQCNIEDRPTDLRSWKKLSGRSSNGHILATDQSSDPLPAWFQGGVIGVGQFDDVNWPPDAMATKFGTKWACLRDLPEIFSSIEDFSGTVRWMLLIKFYLHRPSKFGTKSAIPRLV